jgi:hypothetical protein
MNQTVEWNKVFLNQVLFSAVTVIIVGTFAGSQPAASAAAGAAVTTGNMGILAWTWSRLFAKKSIALAGAIIVTKYAILVAILYWILQQSWVQGIWLMTGIISFLPTMAVLAARSRDEFGKDN